MMPPRIAIDRDDIASVVHTFYQRVRQDSTLGPVFAKHVTNWTEHEEKITRFWANAILFEKSYDGNPMQAHLEAGNVRAQHFATWLALFDKTLTERLNPEQSAQWSHLAHRIGRGLSMGVTDQHRQAGAVPNLSTGF
ncbi:MAG: group III truncated hemoglobin [Aliishimia sp.]